MKTSPSTPFDLPFSISSVLASCCQGGRCTTHLQVHVAVGRHEVALVLQAPLEAHVHRLAGELLQQRLGIHGLALESQARGLTATADILWMDADGEGNRVLGYARRDLGSLGARISDQSARLEGSEC